MIADYSKDPFLYEQCLTLIDSCFPGIKALANKGRTHNAYWDKSSIPFIVKQDQEVIAHLGLLPFHVLVESSPFNASAIHGICTKVEHRRKGHFKQLMLEALHYSEQHFDFSFLFTDQPDLYEPFGFKIIDEYDFEYDFPIQNKKQNNLRKLNLDNQQDLNLLQELYLNRLPHSNRFSIVKETVISTLNALHEPVFYIESINTLIVYQIKDNTLFLKDVVFKKSPNLDAILKSIPEVFSKVVLQFCPDQFLTHFKPIKATTECYMMISNDFDLGSSLFRYPEPQRC